MTTKPKNTIKPFNEKFKTYLDQLDELQEVKNLQVHDGDYEGAALSRDKQQSVKELIKDLKLPMEKVYFSSILKEKLPHTYKSIKSHLKNRFIEFCEIENSNDIWVRDYMPIQLSDDSYVQFNFNPSYLKGYDELKTDPKYCLPKEVVPIHNNLIIDGGNVVLGMHNVILTDQVYRENDTYSKNEVLDKLGEAFGKRRIIIIPKEQGDLFGHSDGMLRFLNKDTVIVNDYSRQGVSKTFMNKLFGTIADEGLNTLLCPYDPEDRLTKHKVPSASGNYINFLETNYTVFVPQFGINTDDMAMAFFKKHFKKKVIGVDCTELAEHGGLLNCISWNKGFIT